MKMIIMKGLPASGKSTKAKQLIEEYGNFVRINKDLLRTMLHFDKFNGKNEGITQNVAKDIVTNLIKQNINVIIDDTNLNPNTLQSWIDLANTLNCTHEIIELNTLVSECVERDSIRNNPVGKSTIVNFALQYNNFQVWEGVIVCDLDGTLCDIKHRLHFLDGEQKNWKEFFSNLIFDKPRNDVIDIIDGYKHDGDTKLILVSARPETYRKETELWLRQYHIDYFTLIMRREGDTRPDDIVKKEIYDKYLSHLPIVCVIDDRPSVIRMWKSLNLKVEDVGDGIDF